MVKLVMALVVLLESFGVEIDRFLQQTQPMAKEMLLLHLQMMVSSIFKQY
jgi:hypothetical protein